MFKFFREKSALLSQMHAAVEAMQKQVAAQTANVTALKADFADLKMEVANLKLVARPLAELDKKLAQVEGGLKSDFLDLKTELTNARPLAELEHKLAQVDAALATIRFEAANGVAHIGGHLESLRGELATGVAQVTTGLGSQMRALDNRQFEGINAVFARFDALENMALPNLAGELHGVARPLAELDKKLAQVEGSLKRDVLDLKTELTNARPLAELDHKLAQVDAALTTIRFEAANGVAHIGGHLESLRGELATSVAQVSSQMSALDNQKFEGNNAVFARFDALENIVLPNLAGELRDVARPLTQLDHKLAQVDAALTTVRFEAANGVAHIGGHLESLRGELANSVSKLATGLSSQLSAVDNRQFEGTNTVFARFDALENIMLPELAGELHEACAVQLEAIAAAAPLETSVGERPRPRPDVTYATSLVRAEADEPAVYRHWQTRLDAMAAAFAETKHGNAANIGDVYSRLFKVFVERHAKGQILDVGCGPFGVPFYLQRFPIESLSGLEPLPENQNPNFACVQGISEYLPWDDQVFDTVVSGTSLDHSLSLDRSIAEMMRVLKPGGRILLWIGSIPGSPEFRPHRRDFEPSDEFHLFHFDVTWFEPLLEKRFKIVEKQRFKRTSFDHVFYCLTLRSKPTKRAESNKRAEPTKRAEPAK